VVSRLLRMVHRSYVESPAGQIRVTASAGVAAVQLGDTVHTLVERADRMLYEAKRAGRNCLKYDGPEGGAE
jgi:diguanylate cyclase (GGDEF)-like protein